MRLVRPRHAARQGQLRLDEEQVKLIITRLQWNIVGEVAMPPLFEHRVIGRTGNDW